FLYSFSSKEFKIWCIYFTAFIPNSNFRQHLSFSKIVIFFLWSSTVGSHRQHSTVRLGNKRAHPLCLFQYLWFSSTLLCFYTISRHIIFCGMKNPKERHLNQFLLLQLHIVALPYGHLQFFAFPFLQLQFLPLSFGQLQFLVPCR
ncbi:unnamed protein product, partial [Brassica napus]